MKYKWLALFIVSSAAFLSVIDIFIVNVAIPSIKRGMHGTDGDSQLVISLYLIGYAAFLITGGRMGDHFGRKKVFIVSMLLFTVASGLCGASQTPLQLNAARFIQGISAALMVPQSITYIHLLFPDHRERIKALGIYGSIAGTASVIGQFLGGVLPDVDFIVAGWRLIFLINLPLGIVSCMFAFRFLKESRVKQSLRFDYTGVLLLTVTLIGLIYPLIRGRELGWPLWSIIMMGAAVLLLLVFVNQQKRKLIQGEQPLINVKLFAFRDFNIGLCAVLFYFMVQDSYFVVNAVYLQTGLGISSSATGILFVSQGIGFVIASLISIPLINRYGKRVLQTGVMIMIIALVLHLIFIRSAQVSPFILFPVLFLYGTGCGSVLPSLLTMALKSIPADLAGAASGMYTTFQQTAIALGIGIVGGVFFNEAGQAGYVSAYQIATGVNIVLLLVVVFFLYMLPAKEQY